MELRVKANDESLQTVNDFIHSLLPSVCDEMILYQIDLAVEEIFVNIAHYSGSEKVWIDCGTDEKGLFTVVFRDCGKPFNPLERADPDITLSAEERDIGGLGIFLTKKFMTSVSYKYENEQNILTIKKSFS
jgi:anti-sigma regulatory factor (Ser/Thr protein kinase)